MYVEWSIEKINGWDFLKNKKRRRRNGGNVLQQTLAYFIYDIVL